MFYIEKQGETITGKGTCPDGAVLNEGQFEASEVEYNAVIFPVSVEVLKRKKIDELKTACNAEILAGFESDAHGTIDHYGLEYEDQINIEALKNNVALGIITDGTLEYYAKGKPCELWTNAQFMQLYQEAMQFKTVRVKRAKELIALAEVATTEAELDAIVW